MNPYQTGERHSSPNLVRLNIHIKRHQTPLLISIAERIAQLKGRGVRLGEALELVLKHVARVPNEDLLKHLQTDQQCKDWVNLKPVQREPKALLPRLLRASPAPALSN
jgi:hypothetical protein